MVNTIIHWYELLIQNINGYTLIISHNTVPCKFGNRIGKKKNQQKYIWLCMITH